MLASGQSSELVLGQVTESQHQCIDVQVLRGVRARAPFRIAAGHHHARKCLVALGTKDDAASARVDDFDQIDATATECRGRGRTARRRTLKVDVPAGIEGGQRIRLSGRGHAGEHGGPEGDLYVLVHVREDERFVRDGQDLVTAVDVPAPAAALGTTVQVPTLDGDAELELEPGVQPGETVTLRGRGLPPLRRGPTGDLRVIVNVLIPRRLNPEQRELLEQLHGTLTEENLRSDEGVFAKLRRVLRA